MQINNTFSSVRGKIKKLFLAVPDEGDMPHFERIASIAQQLSDGAGLLVWCNSADISAQLKNDLESRGIQTSSATFGDLLPASALCVLVSPAAGREAYSRWVRDAFVFRALDADGTVAFAKTGVPKHSDLDWAKRHIQTLRFDDGTVFALLDVVVPVAGGNFLADHDFVLMGAQQLRSHLTANAKSTGLPPFATFWHNKAGIRVIEIGAHTTAAPRKLAHLDLYLSLTGCLARSSGRYVVFVAQCALLSATPQPDLEPIVGRMNQYLDAVAVALEAEGFQVLRNPVPVLKNEQNGAFYLCALNNCLTEVTASNRIVWLPNITEGQEGTTYHAQLQQAEQDNLLLWARLGFDARLIAGDFHTLLDEEGALHCFTNELLRMPPDSPPIVVDL